MEPKIQPVAHLDGAGAAKLLAAEPDVVVLDVRTPAEFAEGHVDKAVNIDFRGGDFAAKLKDLDRSKKYLVHCKSGGRSTSALDVFKELGFAQVVHLDGGFLDWQKAGQPVAK